MNADSTTTVCLTIAGLDPSGGAGIAADIKTFSAFGCYAAAVLTSVTYQNTQGVFGAKHQSGESVARQIGPVFDDFEIAAVKTGMLPTVGVISAVAEALSMGKTDKIVVDPVVRSTSGFDLIDDRALKELVRKLFPQALIVTPNLQEAERIAGFEIRTEDDFRNAAESILSFGPQFVLIKGGHLAPDDSKPARAVDRLFWQGGYKFYEAEYIDTMSTHGTGCTLSSAIAANLANGKELAGSVGIAKEFVTEAIRTSPSLGKGHSPVNHWAGVKIVGER